MSAYSVFVSGIPQPQGSAKAYVRGGRAVVTSDNAKLRPWRDSVSAAVAEAVAEHGTIGGAVEVRLEFTFLRPSSHYGKNGKLRASAPDVPAVRPDIDKCERAVFDALTTSRAIEDDGRIVSSRATKRYAADEALPGVRITIAPFDWADRS